MSVMIGMDPHKRSATIEVVDDRGRVLAASMVGVQDAPGSRPPAPPRSERFRTPACGYPNVIG